MTQSLAESGRALLEALGGNITKRPRTLSETVTEINKLTDEADRTYGNVALWHVASFRFADEIASLSGQRYQLLIATPQ
jgi:hypothetical protein